MIRRSFFIIVCFFLLSAHASAATSDLVKIEYFFSSGCVSCIKINQETLPALERKFSNHYMIIERELSNEANYLRLVQLQEETRQKANEPIYMGLNGRILFSGVNAIQTGLLTSVESELKKPNTLNLPDAVTTDRILATRAEGFHAFGMFTAGLVDGLNPCAMASLIFMMGILVSAKVKGRLLLMVGFLFCLSSFVTYSLLGLGCLKTFKALSAFTVLRVWINRGMILSLLVLSFLSIRDALRFMPGRKSNALSLKMPEFIREYIRRYTRLQIRTRPILLAALVLGFLVTITESVCTGQLYVPTLAWMAKTVEGHEKALRLLGLYNIGFIIPLATVFGAMICGTSIFSLLGWQQRHVKLQKISLACLFLALAVGLFILT